MKTVLIVAYYFPPIAASGAMRPLGFCRHLQAFGWQPWVVTTTPDSVFPPHPVDQELRRRLPQTIDVDLVPYADPLKRVIAWRNRWLSPRAMAASEAVPLRQVETTQSPMHEQGTLGFLKDVVLDWMFEFPDPQCAWMRAVVKHFLGTGVARRPQVVLATGSPWTGLLVGRALARHFDVPLIVDYRDPWTSNPYSPYRSSFLSVKAKKIEQAICQEAAWVIANTEELRHRMVSDYPEIANKCVTLTNGFDRETLGLLSENGASSGNNSGQSRFANGYEICHFGTVYGKRSPFALFQAIRQLHEEGRLSAQHIRLRFIGTWDHVGRECDLLAQDLEKLGFVKREPPVPHEACVRQMKSADVLLVLQPDSPLQVPAKIYEYVAVGRPLLLIGGEGATANFVQRHQLGVSCANQVGPIRDLLTQLIGGTVVLSAPTQENVARFDYRSLTRELAHLLESSSGRTTGS
ncbi:MAG: glycosyltransferase [Nitrospira defluvii]|nr:glycosyltransferase [Nitrospira defluvii]